jgi:hypothetical protein
MVLFYVLDNTEKQTHLNMREENGAGNVIILLDKVLKTKATTTKTINNTNKQNKKLENGEKRAWQTKKKKKKKKKKAGLAAALTLHLLPLCGGQVFLNY